MSTDEQVVDVMTKPLSRVNFEYFCDKLGVVQKDFPHKEEKWWDYKWWTLFEKEDQVEEMKFPRVKEKQVDNMKLPRKVGLMLGLTSMMDDSDDGLTFICGR